jgi:hypothetical protein
MNKLKKYTGSIRTLYYIYYWLSFFSSFLGIFECFLGFTHCFGSSCYCIFCLFMLGFGFQFSILSCFILASRFLGNFLGRVVGVHGRFLGSDGCFVDCNGTIVSLLGLSYGHFLLLKSRSASHLGDLVAVEHELLTHAGFSAALRDSESGLVVSANSNVAVVNVDSTPLRGIAIGTYSDVLVPCVDREIFIDEVVLSLSETEVIPVGLPVLTLLGKAHINRLLGWLLSEKRTARAVVLCEERPAAG